MKRQLLFLALGVMLLSSCTKKTTEQLPSPTGTFEGFVILHDEWGNVLPFDSVNNKHNSGVKISLDSTSYSTTTDSNGRYVLKGIPADVTYNFTFSKAGYGSYNVLNVTLPSTGNAPSIPGAGNTTLSGTVNASVELVNLYKNSSTIASVSIISPTSNPNKATRDTTVTVGPGYDVNPTTGQYQTYNTATNYPFNIPGSFKIGVTLTDSGNSTTQPRGSVVFFSTKPNVSSANYEGYINLSNASFGTPFNAYSPYYYTAQPANVYPYGYYSYGIKATTGIGDLSLTYPTGTKLYFIAYGYSVGNTSGTSYTTNQYQNTIYGTTVFPNLGTPSAIVSFVTN